MEYSLRHKLPTALLLLIIFCLLFGFYNSCSSAKHSSSVRRYIDSLETVAYTDSTAGYLLYVNLLYDDTSQAIMWLRQSAEHGYAKSQYVLSLLLSLGKELPKDEAEALHWEKEAAKNGEPSAQWSLGMNYLGRYGERGVPRDYQKGFELISASAKQGEKIAISLLAQLYENGQGTKTDTHMAFELYKGLAEKNWRSGQNSLGRCYLLGIGCQRDRIRAYMWLNIARTNGDDESESMLNDLEREMSQAEVQTAQQLSSDWLDMFAKNKSIR